MKNIFNKLKVISITSIAGLLSSPVYAVLEDNGVSYSKLSPIYWPVRIISAIISVIIVGIFLYKVFNKKIEKKNIWKHVLAVVVGVIAVVLLGSFLIIITTPAA